MALGQLTGTPWHVGKFTRAEGDDKRHRSRCQFFENGLCLKLERRCHGSARCDSYQVRSADFKQELPSFRSVLEKQFYRGRLVDHPKFGIGTIKELTAERVLVTFRGDKTVAFDLQVILDKNIFQFPQ